MTQPLFVSAPEITELATIDEYVEYVRQGYREQGEGTAVLPRQRVHTDHSAELMTYLSVLPTLGVMGGYLYSSQQDQWYLTPLFDSETGQFRGLVDGSALSPYKTAAASAVAVDEMAKADATSLLLFGSGPQAQSQAKAIASVRDVKEIWIRSLKSTEAAHLAETLEQDLGTSTAVVNDADEFVPQADVIVTATRAREPVFDGSLVRPGTHITALGQSSLGKRELDGQVVAEATYVADSRSRCLEESGEFNTPIQKGRIQPDHLHAELGDVVAGTAPGRIDGDEVTVFDSGGTAIETVAAAALVLERASAAGTGTPFPLSSLGDAPTRI